LVTGGAGFIGSALIRFLITHTDDRVINVDKLTYAGRLSNVEEVSDNDRYHFEQVDICDKSELEAVFEKYEPTLVVHLAAESHVDRSIKGPLNFIETNVVGTFCLLDVALCYWRGLPAASKASFLFHHVSTDEVYGDLPHPDDMKMEAPVLFNEQTPYAPSSPYSASKASSDHLVRAWFRTYGLPTLVTNCSNNYGPYQFPEKLIPLTILNAMNKKPLPVYGVGDQIRDWLFVDDHVRALKLVGDRGVPGETYNIGGHNEKRNIEVVHTICDVLKDIVGTDVEYRDLITFVGDRPGHDRRYAIDATKIHQDLGWKPTESFESGILKTVNWYVNNLSWCQSL